MGTLDHTPNRVALEKVCAEIERQSVQGLELRLVGRPAVAGEAFAARYPFVRYLGVLDDRTLRCEAAGWSLFLNPIFWLSRGASMKLGQALAWGLPVLSTRSGARGYEWKAGRLPLAADDPVEFVGALGRILQTSGETKRIQAEVSVVALSSATTDSLGRRLAEQLP